MWTRPVSTRICWASRATQRTRACTMVHGKTAARTIFAACGTMRIGPSHGSGWALLPGSALFNSSAEDPTDTDHEAEGIRHEMQREERSPLPPPQAADRAESFLIDVVA